MSNPPQRFRPYNTPDDESSPDAKTRRIDSPPGPDQEDSWQQMVNPDWRAPRRRTSPRPSASARRMRMPDAQRIGTWMNQGGTRIIVGGAAVVVVLFIVVLLLNRRTPTPQAALVDPTSALPTSNNQPPPGQIITGTQPPAPATTNPQQPAVVPPPGSEQPAAPSANRLTVTNTGVEGLFLRAEPNTGATILKTLPEGAQVEKLGEQTIDGRSWFNVRDAESTLVGWAAGDFLLPAP